MDSFGFFNNDFPSQNNNNNTKSYNYSNNNKNQDLYDKIKQNIGFFSNNNKNYNNNFINNNHSNNILNSKNNFSKKENNQIININEPNIPFFKNFSKEDKIKKLENENSRLKCKIVDLNKTIIQLNKKIDLYENILNSNNLSTNFILNNNKKLIEKNENSILKSLNKNQPFLNMGIPDNNTFNNINDFFVQNNNYPYTIIQPINNYDNLLNKRNSNNKNNQINNNNNINLDNFFENKSLLNQNEINNEYKYNIDSSFENENNMSCSFESYNDENNIDVDNMTYEELLELENKIGYVKKGVSIEQKLSLKIEQYSPNKIDCKECVICKELFKENEFIRILNCSHVFHINCIDEWFKDNKICPICKKEVE